MSTYQEEKYDVDELVNAYMKLEDPGRPLELVAQEVAMAEEKESDFSMAGTFDMDEFYMDLENVLNAAERLREGDTQAATGWLEKLRPTEEHGNEWLIAMSMAFVWPETYEADYAETAKIRFFKDEIGTCS